ncbi:hypothetical protein A8F95_21230 [Bacillus wudalianchiensis]|uniref:PucR family transcriptional regulator n=2 Tax=Pseudobacillus wudalianchiensis TaxID=1743143 RepID=A0A1B9B2Q8_9BACI|nr:hypothetical protein A8F95_21230 [Bacillus wudalianchiensis]
MKKTRLVAGHKGIENNIKWVTIVEVLGDIDRLQAGEFLITTGFGISDSEEQLEVFHKLLQSKLLSGIAIYTGFYMKKIPISFVELANENDLPLIEIPTDINFSEITKAMLEQIVNNQMHLLGQAENIHRELTNLILNDQSLTEVTEQLAQLTNSDIVIYNELHQTIYTNQKNSDQKLSQMTLSLDGQKINVSNYLVESLKRESRVNFTFENHISTVCPIIAKQSCYGWIVMTKPKEHWRELDGISIEQAAPIYAMEFLKKQAIEEAQLRIHSNFLDDIFNQNYLNEKVIIDQGLKLGYDLSLNQSVFHLIFKQVDGVDGKWSDKLYHLTDQILRQKMKQHMIQTKLNSIIFLTNVDGKTKEDKYQHCLNLAEELLRNWTYCFPNIELIIGIGRGYDKLDELGKSAQEAQYAVKLSGLIGKDVKIVHYDDLGIYDLLLQMERSGISLTSIYEQHISGLLSDNDKEINLIETLDSYFKNNQSIQNAAKELYIHRHTLRYRLNQIEIRTGMDIKSTEDLLKLQLSVMAYKLVNI